MNIKEKVKNSKGITLIALVITIIILIILAGVSINVLLGENGIITKAKQTKKEQKIAEITDKLELYKADLHIEDLGKLTLERYLEKLINENVIQQSDIQETGQENSKYITVEGEYVFLIEQEESGNIKIEYLGTADQMIPKIRKLEYIQSATNIKIILEVSYNENGNYQYFIKESTTDTYGEGKTLKNNEYIFEGLKPGTEYDVKVIVTNNKNLTDEKEVRISTNKEGVTYYIDTDNIQNQTASYGESVLNPSFTPAKEGYTFIGWREDNTAEDNVITEKTMQTEAINLYAVFKKEVTVTYDANGGDSTPDTQTDYIYYNNGNTVNPTFTLANAISRADYIFQKWAMGSTTGEEYEAEKTVTLSSDTTLYAIWAYATTSVRYTGSKLVVNSNGMYSLAGFNNLQGSAFSLSGNGIVCNIDISKVKITGTIQFVPVDGWTYYGGFSYLYVNGSSKTQLGGAWCAEGTGNGTDYLNDATVNTTITNLKKGDIIDIRVCSNNGGPNDRTSITHSLTFSI